VSQAGLGLLGGTFDPIHFAHVRLGRTARATLSLEKVLLIPAADPPLKPRCVASAMHRVRMVELAIASEPELEVCTIELSRPGPSYTVDTLTELRERQPECDLWFILGSDALRGLDTWHRPERLFELAHFGVVVRSGEPVPTRLTSLLPSRHAAAFKPSSNGWVHPSGHELRLIPFEPVEISSTEIRERLRTGQSIRSWLPEPVIDYIHTYRLYEEDS